MTRKITIPAFLGILAVSVVPVFSAPQEARALDASINVDPVSGTPVLQAPILETPILSPIVSGLVSLDRESVSFGEVSVDASGTSVPVTITNNGTTPLEVTDINLTGLDPADFVLDTLSPLPLVVAPGESVTLPGVSFVPLASGASEAVMEIVTSAGPILVPLTGTATESPTATPTPATPPPATPVVSPAPGATPGPSAQNTPPRVSSIGSKTTRDRTPLIRARVTDTETNLTKSNIRLFVDNKSKGKFAYNSKKDELRYASPKLKAGKHKVKIVAQDAQGLKTTKSYTIRVK